MLAYAILGVLGRILPSIFEGFGGSWRGLGVVLGRLVAFKTLQDFDLGANLRPKRGPRGVPDRENSDQNPSLGALKLGSLPGGTPGKEKILKNH